MLVLIDERRGGVEWSGGSGVCAEGLVGTEERRVVERSGYGRVGESTMRLLDVTCMYERVIKCGRLTAFHSHQSFHHPSSFLTHTILHIPQSFPQPHFHPSFPRPHPPYNATPLIEHPPLSL
jgi:hypothetical protein